MAKSRKVRARRRRGTMRHSGPRGRNIPVLPVVGVAAGIGLPALRGLQSTQGMPMTQKATFILDSIGQSVYGYSTVTGTWTPSSLPQFWAPVAGTVIAHKVASKLGINAILSRAKVGFTL